MLTYGKFEKFHLVGEWFCVRRPWFCKDTKCSGFDFVRKNGKLEPFPEDEADAVVMKMNNG